MLLGFFKLLRVGDGRVRLRSRGILFVDGELLLRRSRLNGIRLSFDLVHVLRLRSFHRYHVLILLLELISGLLSLLLHLDLLGLDKHFTTLENVDHKFFFIRVKSTWLYFGPYAS